MKKIIHKSLSVSLFIILAIGLAACGKARLFGKNVEGKAHIQSFDAPLPTVYKSVKEALSLQGYSIQKEDNSNYTLETSWQPTTSDSHFVRVFNRQDRGTVGAYHKLIVELSNQGEKTEVKIKSLARTFVSNLESTGIEEHKILVKVADFTRKANIDVTNVGLQEK